MEQGQLEFEVGQLVMMPLSGPFEITGITEDKILGSDYRFLELRSPEDNARLRIPVPQAPSRGVRGLMSKDVIDAAMEQPVALGQPDDRWRTRRSEWLARLRSGEPRARLEVLSEMRAIPRNKITPDELRMHQSAHHVFCYEMQQAHGLSAAEANQKLNQFLEGGVLTPVV